ncbi:3-hydroxy-acyl-CoA dehydrogenase [Klebsiella pneumoniae subsp. pneumoniae]|uniref:3-hydroxy-acyl-CoA dehydrogenase n=1 Tax=Klebsiella pneumoniae subsp. pneumoniae TaxID=72407 RepID=A0A377ZTM4_KLEPN|nr:3-hydroxy-acyl-CoA dehydrogenase [Klebsiella pneumoniae subsp. pneumoniae]
MMTTSLATVAVIGSGTMGAGIAEVAAPPGIRCVFLILTLRL